uniref:Uncharacterized protein n=1 Tax=Parascaris univalens TaxID=6257 RepID=A0A915C462_PARUN
MRFSSVRFLVQFSYISPLSVFLNKSHMDRRKMAVRNIIKPVFGFKLFKSNTGLEEANIASPLILYANLRGLIFRTLQLFLRIFSENCFVQS